MLWGRETEIWREKKKKKRRGKGQGSEINISSPWYRYTDRKVRIYCSIRANAQLFFTSEAVVLIEQHDWVFNVVLFTPSVPLFLSLSASLLSITSSLALPLSPHLFSVTRGLSGGEPMSAEDVGRVWGTVEMGGEEERRVNERRYRTLTCFGLISAGCFVLKPLALILGLQHLELIITHTPALLQLTVYTGYYIHSNTNFIQLMCWNLMLHRNLNCCYNKFP